MRLTTDKNDWTPIDPNLENELLNAYERIAELERELTAANRRFKRNCEMLRDSLLAINYAQADLISFDEIGIYLKGKQLVGEAKQKWMTICEARAIKEAAEENDQH